MGSHTELKLLKQIKNETDLNGIKVDFGTGGNFHAPHDAGDLIVGEPLDAVPAPIHPENPNPNDDVETLTNLFIIQEMYTAAEDRRQRYIQRTKEDFDPMIDFAMSIGATPVLAVRWSSRNDWSPGPFHLLKDAREVRRTSAGNINVRPEKDLDDYERVEEFFEKRKLG